MCVCFLPIHSGHQVRWTYQPGSHRRKVTQDGTILLLYIIINFCYYVPGTKNVFVFFVGCPCSITVSFSPVLYCGLNVTTIGEPVQMP